MRACGTCEFAAELFDPDPEDANVRECRRRPPAPQRDLFPDCDPLRGVWPLVTLDDWCGEYRPKE
jgi:hypothetical protein